MAGVYNYMPADPTLEFLAQFDDPTKWIVKRRVPLFKPHDRVKRDEKGKNYVAYKVTDSDLPVIAEKMRVNQRKGIPARMTVGHIDADSKESDNPEVIGYWLNAETGTFGPAGEPCLYADSYVKRDCADKVKGRPYRSAEYYRATNEIRGAALLSRDPSLDLGTVELYQLAEGGVFVPAPGELYMADSAHESSLPGVDGPPEGHDQFCRHMEHYAKSNPWMGHAKECYEMSQSAAAAPSATNAQVPQEVERMQRDEQAVNYAKLKAEIEALTAAVKSRDETVAVLTRERDQEQCERMVKQLQLEGYSFKASVPDTVAKLMKKSTAEREEWADTVREFGTPAPGREMVEVYEGSVEGPIEKNGSTAELAAKAARAAFGKGEDGYLQSLASLKNGHANKN